MQIDYSLCNPSECDLECFKACMDVHGDPSPLTFNEGDTAPKIDQDDCTQCMMCVRACPLDAIAPSGTKKRKETKHLTKKDLEDEYVPYEVSEDWEDFSEADTIFARVHNDSEFKNYQQNEWHGADAMISKNIPGYGKFEHDMSSAGWTLYDSRRNINPKKTDFTEPDPTSSEIKDKSPTLTRDIKRAARFYGASLVGVAKIDRRWLYSSNRERGEYTIPETINRVIVMAVEMDYEGIATSPAFTSAANTALGYSRMAFIEIELSALIRKLGYSAIPCGNDISLSVPQAVDAGLGMIGRHGILITKKFGPRVRIAKVLTDMPIHADRPDKKFCESVTRFCEVCEKCATTCPSQSIPYGKTLTWKGETRSNIPGVKKWYINPETCYNFWVENGSECSNCIRSCPYNKKNNFFHRIIVWITKNFPWMDRIIIKMDDLMRYGKQKDPLKYLDSIEKK
ncbi:MAG: reductive dehalogenase [Candidatus Thorarchaeota archaeon]|nr:reductive dehalogenase [Candidatus Thorarchaeota archaeon]